MKNKKQYEHLLKWIKRTKEHLVECFDNKCGVCGYDKCIPALDFHHVNSKTKKFSISSWNSKNWKSLVNECKKCVLLCCRCHRELHEGVIVLPKEIKRFDMDKLKIIEERKRKASIKIKQNKCPMCTNMKRSNRKYCSIKCSAKAHNRLDWDAINLYELVVVKKLPMVDIGKMVGVTDNAVRKRLKKLGLPVTMIERELYLK